MMDRLLDALKRHVGAMLASMPQARWGTVESVNPNRPAVKVRLQPEGVLSGWLPVAQPSAGAGVTVLPPIAQGTQAFLVPELGSPGHDFVVTGFAHSDAAQIPAAANANGTGGTQNAATVAWSAGEYLIVANGSVFRICTNGSIYLRPGGGTVFIDGNLVCNGDVSDRHGSLDRLRGHYNAHIHTQGSDSNGDSEQPTSTTTAPDPE